MLSSERKSEILGISLIALSILLFLALVTDGYQGRIDRPIDGMMAVPNLFGAPGATVAGVLYLIVGGGSHVLYLLIGVWGGILLRHKPLDRLPVRLFGAALVTVSVSALVQVDMTILPGREHPMGGVIGAFFGSTAHDVFGVIGAHVILIATATIGVLLSTEFLFVRVADRAGSMAVMMANAAWALIVHLREQRQHRKASREAKAAVWRKALDDRAEPESAPRKLAAAVAAEPAPLLSSGYDDDVPDRPEGASPRERTRIWLHNERAETEGDETAELPFDDVPELTPEIPEPDPIPEPEVVTEPAAEEDPAIIEETDPVEAIAPKPKPKKKTPPVRRKTLPQDELPADYVYPKRYTRPSLDLFTEPPEADTTDWSERLLATSQLLEETLQTFGIEAQVTDVTRGPTITRYELEPAPGIKVARFQALADDIALSLKAHRVRVEAPIPGKGRVGIEVPNSDREPVVLRELLEARNFRNRSGILNLALGKDIAGDSMVADLARMPHLLVAGATGAGKTVCVKSLLASMLCAKTPDELQLMLIDPKMVELSIFNDIPHLITPVVTDPKKAATSLTWLITEMEERYRLFAHLKVRNIEVYNESVDNGEIEMVDDEDEDETAQVDAIRKLPYIVCVIDELADLMMLARAEVEDAIARLAQLARAVGIHLIIATQRPSVDVLTGVIKANFPARISFQVSSRVDSRCILDEIGAERLIGMGDLLYLPAGQSKPTRVQGAFVSDEEMNGLIAYLKTQAPPQYRDEIEKFGGTKDGVEDLEDQDDDMFEDAVRVVLETGQASISMVQRRLRVGYARAARLIDMMEMRGIVGPHVGSKAREILVDSPPRNEVA